MKNQNNMKTALLSLAFLMMGVYVSAQQKVWTGQQKNYRIDSTANTGSLASWSLKNGTSNGTVLTGGGARAASAAVNWTNSTAAKVTDSVLVNETVNSCVGENQRYGVTVYPNPTVVYKDASNATQTTIPVSCPLSSPGNITIELSNYSAASLGDLGNFTFNYQLKDGATVLVSGSVSTSASASTTITGAPLASIAAALTNSGASTKNYTLVINAVSASPGATPSIVDAGALPATGVATLAQLTIAVSAKPSTSAITPY